MQNYLYLSKSYLMGSWFRRVIASWISWAKVVRLMTLTRIRRYSQPSHATSGPATGNTDSHAVRRHCDRNCHRSRLVG